MHRYQVADRSELFIHVLPKAIFVLFILVAISFLSGAWIGAYAQGAPASGSIGYWPLDGDASDASGHGLSGVILGGVRFEDGLFGQAADLNGKNGRILIADDPDLRFTGSFSISAWINTDRPGQSAKIISRRRGYQFWFLGLDNGAPCGGVGMRGYRRVIPKSHPGRECADMGKLSPNRWHHLVFIHDHAARALWMYVDGRASGPFSVRSDFQLPAMPGVQTCIGADSQGTNSFFQGRIDDLSIYDRALSQAEVVAMYEAAELPRCYWTQEVVEVHQGVRADGRPVPPVRSNPSSMLGPLDCGAGEGTFYSLGLGGWAVLEFPQPIVDGWISIYEATREASGGLEKAEVYAWDGSDWVYLGLADNQGPPVFPPQDDHGRSHGPNKGPNPGPNPGPGWGGPGPCGRCGPCGRETNVTHLKWTGFAAQRFKIVDATESTRRRNGAHADGFDIDAVRICGRIQTQVDPPTVSLSVDATDIIAGQSVTLTWESTDAETVVIEPGIGSVETSGSVEVTLEETTVYTITATGPGGTASASVTINVTPREPTVSLSVDSTDIIAGQSATLTWESTDAETVVIEPGIGSVETSGSIEVTLEETTVYTITATGPGGTASASITINVTPREPTVSLSVDSTDIIAGQSATLTWESTDAETVVIEPGIGSVETSGSVEVTLEETVTYIITATGPGGTASASVTINVTPREPTVGLTADSTDIIAGQSATLTWESTDAETVVIEPGIGSVETSGSVEVALEETAVYTITATGAGGTASASITINVTPREPTVSLSSDATDIIAGQSATLTWESTDAETVVIEPGIGSVETSGSVEVTLEETVTYIITATGAGGTASASVTINVTPREPTVSLSVDATDIIAGQSATLTWESTDAETVVIEPGIGSVETSGSVEVTLEETTVYTITATGAGGTASTSATINVTYPRPLVSLTSDASEIIAGRSVTLIWESQWADSVSFTPDLGAADTAGAVSVSPSQTTVYTIDAAGPGGTTTASLTIQVIHKPQVSLTAEPSVLMLGESATLTWSALYADTVEIDNGLGVVEDEGEVEVSPGQTAVYTITAAGPGGEATDSVTIHVSQADLIPAGVDASGAVVDGGSLEISGLVSVDLKNTGATDVWRSFDVTVFEDRNSDGVFDPAVDAIIGAQTVSGLASGQEQTLSIPVGGNMLFADNLIHVMADSSVQIPETDETNNVAHSMADCEQTPPTAGEFNPVLEWNWFGSETVPASNQVMCTPKAANLNDDNGDGLIDNEDIPDIIFITFSGVYADNNARLRAISGDGGGELFTVVSEVASPGFSPAVGDIDGDGLPEILVFTNTLNLLAFENDGSLKWKSAETTTVYNPGRSAITIADIDADGLPEILIGHHVFNSNGTTKWVGDNSTNDGIACAANLDLQGLPEIVVGNTAYRANGDVYWRSTALGLDFNAIGNLDDDPYPEVVHVGGGKIYLLEHDGEVKWGPVSLGSQGGGPPTIADFDGDGEPEIGVASRYYYFVFEADGSLKWKKTIYDVSGVTGASVFDFEGDGSAEVVFADENYLRIFRGSDGEILFQTSIGSGTLVEYPIIADVDNDNSAEIVVAGNDYYVSGENPGISVFGDANGSWVNTRKIWNQHAYHITNVNDDSTIPAVEPNSWESHNTYRCNASSEALACRDLSASHLVMDQAEYPSSVDLTARVGNSGRLHLAAGVNVSFYNGDPEDGGILLGTVRTTTRLYPGQYEDVALTWADPPDGQLTLYARVDDDGTGVGRERESNENNNQALTVRTLGNNAPIAAGGSDRDVYWGETVYLDGSASSDADGETLTYQWEMTARPDNSQAVLSDPTSATPSFVADSPGVYRVELVVNDGFDDSPADLVTITCQAIIAPDLAGLDQAGAENALISAGLSLGTVVETENDAPAGQVLAQDPAAGTELESGAAVDLTVSLGPPMAAAPDVVGLTQTEAQTVITSAGFVVGTSTGIYSETIPEDQVMYQSPAAGTQAVLGSAVNLIISDGPDPTPDTEAPTVAITLPAVQANIGSSIAIEVTVHDNRGVTDLTVEVNGLSQSVDAGQVIFTPTEIGRCYVTASAVDAAGNQGEAGAWFDAVDPSDATPPSINLTAPSDGHEITAPTEITGEINDTQLDTWIVEYRRVESTDWIQLAEGDEPVSGVLTVFDPTLLKNGLYEIRVRASDKIGNADSAYLTAFVDGQLKVGLNQVAFTDLQVPVSGLNITVIRAYNAGDKRSKDFGHGWSAAVQDLDLMESRAMGDGWYEENVGSFLPQWEIQADEVHLVVVIWPDGRSEAFDMRAEYTDPVYRTGAEVQISFVPREGTTSTLEPVNSQLLLYNAGEIIGSDDLDPFDPDEYLLTTREGWTYTIHDLDGLEKAVDPNGNSLTIDSGGVVHSSGKSIVFQRDSANRITTITDPAGADLVYEYDQNGDLIRFTDQEGRSAEYTYDNDHNLLEIYDPRGVPALECEYDESGRLIATIDANGERVEMNHDLTSYTSVTTDRRGYSTTFTYNENGWVTQKRDHYGYTTNYTYDDRGNKLSETNPLGYTSYFTYDDYDNLLTETDPLGDKTVYTYDDNNRVLTVTDPRGGKTTNTYDAAGNLLTAVDAMDGVTTKTYNTAGRPLTIEDPLGYTTSFEYDAYGNVIGQTDPLGNTTTRTYDAMGNQLTETISRTTP